MDHQHRGRVVSSSMESVMIHCSECGVLVERPLTALEAEGLREHTARYGEVSPPPVRLWQEADSLIQENYGKTYDLLDAFERWSSCHPEVLSCRVDDSHCSSSVLYFVPLGSEESGYDAHQVVYLPQCSGEPPATFRICHGDEKDFFQVARELDRRSRIQGPPPLPGFFDGKELSA